ncbi:MAG: two-component regulator propeller domain-containing protein, partial [Bacteroidota bacterium]
MLNKTGRTLHRLVVVILLLFGYGTSLEAQEDKLYIDRLGSNEGLSANYINCILQDDDGFMWFGTFGGLNRYDGYEIREYKPTPNRPAGISGIRIFDIAADAAGDLWISVKEKGISFYDRSHDTFQTIAHEPDRSGSLPSNAVTDLLVDRQNRLWVGTDRGVSWLDLKDFTPGEPPTFTKVDLPVSSSKLIVRTIFEDRIGNVWVTTDGAVYRTSAPHVSQFRRLESATIQGAQIKSIVQTSSGDILLAGARGLYRQSSVNKDNFYQVGNLQRVASMAYDKDLEHLWVGSASGLYKYAMGGDREEPELLHHYTHDPWDPTSLSANDITSIFMDETKGIWVGTSGGGISKFNPLRKRFYHNEQSYGGPNFIAGTIRAIYQDSRQQVWVGSDGGGVNLSAEKLERGKQAEFRH